MKRYKNQKVEKQIVGSYNVLLSHWGIDVNEMEVEGRYGTTHVIEFGRKEKEPLMLFHGVGDDTALMWIYNAKVLGEYFHVYAVDTIGGPGKSVPGKGYNKEFDDVVWIDELLDALSLEQVYMAGVSNGGYLTQMYTIMRPERVKKGISMAATIPVSSNKGTMMTMMKIFLPEALFPTDKNVKKMIRKMTGSNAKAFYDNEAVFYHFKKLMTGFNRSAMLYHQVKSFGVKDMDAIRGKILYIAGKKDPFMNLGGADLLQQYNMNTLWLEDAGHGINHEFPDAVNHAIISYFTEAIYLT